MEASGWRELHRRVDGVKKFVGESGFMNETPRLFSGPASYLDAAGRWSERCVGCGVGCVVRTPGRSIGSIVSAEANVARYPLEADVVAGSKGGVGRG